MVQALRDRYNPDINEVVITKPENQGFLAGGGGRGGGRSPLPYCPEEGLIHSLVMTEMHDSLPRFKKRLPVGYIPVVVLDYQSTVSCTIARGL